MPVNRIFRSSFVPIPHSPTMSPQSPPPQTAPNQNNTGGVVLDISQEGWEAAARYNGGGGTLPQATYRSGGEGERAQAAGDVGGVAEAFAIEECETCNSRRYVDRSDDPSVSFQSPTHIPPGQSAAAVAAHEREHVVNEQQRADREDRVVVYQSVALRSAICPECGRMYISGGVTRTVTADKPESQNPQESA